MKKFILFFILIVVIGAALLWFFKASIASGYLSKKLKASISVEAVELDKSQIKLKNLKIRNPSGFKHVFAYTCNEVLISYKLNELKSVPTLIGKIDFNKCNLYIDCKNALCTTNNWTAIMNEIAEKESKKTEEKEVVVANMTMNDLHVEIEGTGLIPGIKKEVNIDHIDFGKVTSKEGFPTKQLIVAIFKEAGILEYIKSIIDTNKIFEKYFKAINPFGLNEDFSNQNNEENAQIESSESF